MGLNPKSIEKSTWTREEQKKHSAEWTRQYEKGQRDAEQRIIKLLEMPNGWHETVYVAEEGDKHFEKSCITCLNIELIKGEQK